MNSAPIIDEQQNADPNEQGKVKDSEKAKSDTDDEDAEEFTVYWYLLLIVFLDQSIITN
jgi:hypothetical protein